MANQLIYGFHDLASVADQRVTEVGVEIVSRARVAAITEHERQLNALMGLFVERTTQFKTRFRSASAARLQPLDENGRALPIQIAGYGDRGYPIYDAGIAWGANWITRQKMTVQEASDLTGVMLTADARWVRDNILASLYDDDTRTFTDPMHGSLSVLPLANGDTETYLIQAGVDAGATDNHYLAQANAIGAGADNPFPTIYQELTEHPENGGEVIVLVPTNLKASIEALATFFPITDPNLRLGSGQTELIGNLGMQVPGTIFGYEESKVWLAEWRHLPNSYLVAVTTEGERPLRMREEPEAALQGFKQVAEREDFPFWEAQYRRRAGFGAWNRVGALVQRIGNGTYTEPSGYEAPLA